MIRPIIGCGKDSVSARRATRVPSSPEPSNKIAVAASNEKWARINLITFFTVEKKEKGDATLYSNFGGS
ncbi:MAG: hypothetical protein D8M57_05580 [Candidatus Scalindua sp. AMX11]|nr:MAG: hypothetical protein DWQ00_07205 [Candidatus Scalindua sp.]TDE66004.1 MAG: hypothetical protein D8M57_05580 [Candidatus Scalindua sp. AMX11]